jgi:site-specific recombinase XerD
VFASKRAKGKRPIWGQSIMRKQIHPVIEKLGIAKRIGWHSFRHSYSTLLRHLGTDIKVQQDLLRHSSARLTLDTYERDPFQSANGSGQEVACLQRRQEVVF